jgi:hypothetical protein
MKAKTLVRRQKMLPTQPFFSAPLASTNPHSFFPNMPIQTKLRTSHPGDSAEKQADHMADAFVNHSDVTSVAKPQLNTIQRQCNECDKQDPIVSRKVAINSHSVGAGGATTQAAVAVNSGGHSLPQSTRQPFEQHFGQDFSKVKIHTDIRAGTAAQNIGARAYTLNNHIAFAPGEFSSHTDRGRHLLAHELTHVVQQSRSQDGRVLQRAETDTEDSCIGLSDIKTQVNDKVNNALAEARKVPGTSNTDKLIDETYDRLGAGRRSHPGRTKIEDFLESKLTHGKQVRDPAQANTKYQGMILGLWGIPLIRVLGATIKVDGICIGTDKLGHFFQQGHEYYEIARRQGKGDTAAAEYGISTEIGKFGLATTGVFSNADLEANRQGLAFYDKLSTSPTMSFDISDFISNQWNEETNPNLYNDTELIGGERVWTNLLTDTWEGAFTNDRSNQMNVPVTMKLSSTLRKKLSDDWLLRGSYEFTNDNGAAETGKLIGIITPRKVDVAPGLSKAKAVEGVKIKFFWTESGAHGEGEWVSGGESLLQGTWGRGKSKDNAGLWWAMRK